MPKKGTFTALQKLQPLKADFGKIARENEALEAQKRQEQRIDEDRAQKKLDRRISSIGEMKDVYTGIDSIDKGLAFGINKATQQMLEVEDALLKDPNNTELLLKRANLGKYSANLAQMVNKYKNYATDLVAGVADGRYSQTRNAGKIAGLNQTFRDKNFVADIDKNGMPTFVEQWDNKNRITRGYSDIFDGTDLSQPVEAFNREEYGGLFKDLGTKDILGVADKDGIITRTKELTEQGRAKLDNTVLDYIGENEENASELAHDIWENTMNRKPEDFNYDEVKKWATDEAESRNDILRQDKRDYEGQRLALARGREARLSATARAKGGGTAFEKATANIEPMTDTKTGEPLDLPDYYQKGVTTARSLNFLFSLKKPVKVGIGDEEISVDEYVLNDDNTITYTGKKKVTDEFGEVSWKNVKGGNLNDNESNKFSRSVGFANATELRQASQDKINNLLDKSEQPKEEKTQKFSDAIEKVIEQVLTKNPNATREQIITQLNIK